MRRRWPPSVPPLLATKHISGSTEVELLCDDCERKQVSPLPSTPHLLLLDSGSNSTLCSIHPSTHPSDTEQRKATEEEEALEREWRKMNPSGSSSEEEDRLQPPPPLSSADTDGSTEEKEEDDALRSMFPMSFGAQPKQKPSTQSLHEKWKRKAPPSSRKSSITLNLSSSSSSSSSPAPGKSVAGSSSPGAQVLGKRASRSDGRNQNGNTEQPSSTVEKKSGWDEFSDDDDDDDDSDEDDANPYDLPISHEVSLEGHSRAVSAITLDPSGSRLITGSYDYNFQMYNFSGMDSSMQPFRSKEPEEGHQIRQLRYDRRGGRFLCVTGSAQPQIFDREGFDITKFVRGDMYLHDLVSGSVSPLFILRSSDSVSCPCAVVGTVLCWSTATYERSHQRCNRRLLESAGRRHRDHERFGWLSAVLEHRTAEEQSACRGVQEPSRDSNLGHMYVASLCTPSTSSSVMCFLLLLWII